MELYLQAMIPDAQNRPATPAPPTYPRHDIVGHRPTPRVPNGLCFAFHRTGHCPLGSRCNYQNQCFNRGCYGNHPATKCWRPLQTPYNIPPRFTKGPRPFFPVTPPTATKTGSALGGPTDHPFSHRRLCLGQPLPTCPLLEAQDINSGPITDKALPTPVQVLSLIHI